ncbi:MAG: hypothetical protein KA368_01760 [Acidobacteria bacterium]|nr:hypothetical protein [Acidobacteriota bacterium]
MSNQLWYKEDFVNSIHRLGRRWPQLAALFLAGAVLLTLAAWPMANPVGHGNAAAFISIKLTFKFGKRTNTGTCGPGRGICDITLGVARSGSVEGTVTPQGSDRMDVVFESALPDRTIEIAENIPMEESVARKLGFKSLTVQKGSYALDPGKGKFGGVTLNIKTTK